MVVTTFKAGTDMDDVMAVVTEERAQVGVLRGEGRLGALHLSMERGTIFLEVFAENEGDAEATVRTLPMSHWWDIDVYPTPGIAGVQAAS